MSINGIQIACSDSLRYLGVNFISEKTLSVDISPIGFIRESAMLPEVVFKTRQLLQSML